MVIISNNLITITHNDPSYFYVKMNLTFNDKKNHEIYVFEEKDNNLYIQRGLLPLLKDYFVNSEIKNIENYELDNIFNVSDITYDNYKDILNGITLRDYQFIALRKMILLKRAVIQIATAGGKTEIMSSFLKSIQNKLGYIPTTIIMEPTVKLVESTINRFKKYNIECYSYSELRGSNILNKVIVCHPKSLYNDLIKDNNILKDVKIFIADECHHLRSNTWRIPFNYMNNVEYSIGVSATAISQDHVESSSIREFSPNELLVMGVTGLLCMNMKSGLLIKKKALANPVVIQIHNKANEFMIGCDMNNFTNKVKVRLQSSHRNNLVCQCADFFNDNNRKILILVSTIEWSRKLLKMFSEYDLSDVTIASYGGNRYEVYNKSSEKCISTLDNMDDYTNNKYHILIGTSHLYEGIDIPNLDVVILAYGGRGDRIHLQGLGRVLRKTKNGKYAYIIDFSDTKDPVLNYQSNVRMDRYVNNLQIPNNRIYKDKDIEDLNEIFTNLEE